MKKVTKKLVKEALASFVGWNFAYDFKESQRLVLFNHVRHDRMVEALASRGVDVVTLQAPVSLRTGHMGLRMADSDPGTKCVEAPDE